MADKKKKTAIAIGVGAIVSALLLAVGKVKTAEGKIVYELWSCPGNTSVGSYREFLVSITNTYPEEKTEVVKMTGDFTDEKTIVLSPGETQVVAFGMWFYDAGTFNLNIGGVSCTVEVGLQPCEITALSADMYVQVPGEDIIVTARVENANWYDSLTCDVTLSGVVSMTQTVVLPPHGSENVEFIVTVDWEGYEYIYCDGFSVLVKGEPISNGEPPPGSFHCPWGDFSGDSECEVGTHIAEVHFGYNYPAGTINESSFCKLGVKLALYGYVDPNPELLEKARWAIQNVISGKVLWKNLNASQRNSLRAYIGKVLGVNPDDLFESYGTSMWQAYIRIDEIAPGWTEDWDEPTEPTYPNCVWVVSGFEVGLPLYKDGENMGNVTLIENLDNDIRRVTTSYNYSYYFKRTRCSVGRGFAWTDEYGNPYTID